MEPTEVRIAPAALNKSTAVNVKSEEVDHPVLRKAKADSDPSKGNAPQEVDDVQDVIAPATGASSAAELLNPTYTIYQSATDIEYTPEHALHQGLKMVNKLALSLKGIELGARRQEVWVREIARFVASSAQGTSF